MPPEFYRRVVGYNRPARIVYSASLIRNASISLLSTSGPGTIEGGLIGVSGIMAGSVLWDTYSIYIDGSLYESANCAWLFCHSDPDIVTGKQIGRAHV